MGQGTSGSLCLPERQATKFLAYGISVEKRVFSSRIALSLALGRYMNAVKYIAESEFAGVDQINQLRWRTIC